MVIYIISDGKKGHLTQTRGLARALMARAAELCPEAPPSSCHEVDVSRLSLPAKFFYQGQGLSYPPADLVLCAGHGTHLPAIRLARRMHAPCMVCMKPSLPLRLFSLVIAPQHDFAGCDELPPHVFLTNGALNSITPHPEVEKKETLLLIGGPSKEFGWDADRLLTQISTITRYSTRHMVLTTSRRTPADFVQRLTAECPSIRIEPVESTGPTWVADHLAAAEEVWVTQDSVSMVYEALSSGAPVGIIEMPTHPKRVGKAPSRVARGLSQLVEHAYVTTFTNWAKNEHTLTAGPPLHEADRAAAYILTHFPQLLS